MSTSRIALRCPTLDDVDAITDACQDPEVQRRVPVPVPYRREHAVAYVTTFCEDGWITGERCTWALEVDGAFAGVIGLDDIADGSANLGYWMAPQHRGHGYLTEAVAAVLNFAFDTLELERVEWRAFAGNRGSARVAQRSGFRFEGVRRCASRGRNGREDDWVGSILSTDDRAQQAWAVLDA
ncbi:GNAT family N-acetyltransferase [Paramicrobacterium chengjingii]|uniref:GNAT family N-acetyltransferase n=1 Tax=Paramicrobacterium chengjingii TaxID=2769067 RepID=A0ABX6YPD7_9MICO|nr:GNAT family N-acetyltransferase [Microbacterium chengjingii]